MAFANLNEATQLCGNTMFTRWLAGTLPANIAAFITAIDPSFSDSNPSDRVVGDWIIPLSAVSNQLQGAFAASDDSIFVQCTETVFRLCATCAANGTAAQQTAVLNAMNANLS